MAFENLSESINNLSDNLQSFAKSNAEYYKLNLYKKFIKGAIFFVNMLLLGFVALIVILFLSIAAAMAISNWLEQPSAGFLIVGGFYIIIFILLFAFGKKKIEKIILARSSKTFFND